MKYLDLSFPTPEENLACDEALLDLCEDSGSEEILRVWESPAHFVVLGYSGKVEAEVHLAACQDENIPVLRRPSGGGTVLQGPGCLNFALILKTKNKKPLKNITDTNRFIMKRHQETLEKMTPRKIAFEGLSDLACDQLKFSGNAQRRKKRAILFHGTFLYDFDIPLIEKFLKLPSKQPPYRKQRTHQNFLMNLDIPPNQLKAALRESWGAVQLLSEVPMDRIKQLVKSRYALQTWNFKF